MLLQFRKRGAVLFSLLVVLFILACGLTISPSDVNNPPAFDPTKAALELQATSMSLQLTQAAINIPPTAQPTLPPPPQPTAEATAVPPPTEIPPTPTQDVEALIKSAKILVYENTDARGIGMWIQDALDGLGLKYTQTGS